MTAIQSSSRRRVLRATVLALVVGLFVLVAFVLPAEFGIDPLKTGAALGLTALSAPVSEAPAAAPGVSAAGPATVARLMQDRYEIELQPYEGLEYKYRMEKGAGMVYAWTASGSVGYEFHGEPDGAKKGYFDSYAKSSGRESHGTFVAPSSGIHGWFWENRSDAAVSLTLTTTGFYGDAIEFRNGARIAHRVVER